MSAMFIINKCYSVLILFIFLQCFALPTPPPNELYVYPPTNLTATDEETHIALTWIHSIGSNFPESPVAGYRIYRGLMSGRMGEIAEVPYVDNYTDFDVVPGRTYYYRVGAFTIEGPGYREYGMISPYSNEASIAKRVNCPSLLSRKRLKLFPFEFVNNILSQTVIDSINSDIIPVPEEPLKINGNYNLQIKELGYSSDSIDYVQFLHVDRVSEVFSAVDYHNNFFLYDPITFLSPVLAIDQDSNDITYLITEDDNECYNSDSAGYMIITFDLTPHILHISSALIDANALVKRFEMQCMCVEVNVDTEWVEIGKLPARAFQYKEFVSFSVPSSDTIYVKFVWDNHYKLDCTKLYPNPTLIAPAEIPLVSAVHSSGDTVSNALLAPDSVYVQIMSDEYIDLMFASIAEPDSGIIRDYYFLSYGHYEYDSGYGATGGRGSGSTVLPIPAPFLDPDVITDQEDEPSEEEHDNGKRTAEIDMIPKVTSLDQPKPNPFNATIDIPFDVSEEQIVQIAIYDISGILIDILADKEYEVGRYHLIWDCSSWNSGTYFVKMTAGNYTNTKQIVLIK